MKQRIRRQLAAPAPAEATARRRVLSVDADGKSRREDHLAIEEPLEIRVIVEESGRRARHRFAITMRTPGEDFELAAGFLFSEGVVSGREAIWKIARCESEEGSEGNVVEVSLKPGTEFDPERFRRNVLTTSSCGVCGKAAIEQLRLVAEPPTGDYTISTAALRDLPGRLGEAQVAFHHTGGLHAAALFDAAGRLLLLREDVGRHNALDKLIGARFLEGRIPASNTLVLLSGRASYELVQKAVTAGIPCMAAVGAPSSLAVSTAEEFGVTLAGFLKSDRFNIYSGEERIEG